MPQTRSNVVHRVERRGLALAFVKQRGVASLLDGDDAVANERAALTALAGLSCVPRVLNAEDQNAVWVEAVTGPGIGEIPLGGRQFDVVSRALAAALVHLHSWPISSGSLLPTSPRPWVLTPDDLPPSMLGSPLGSACASVLDVARSADIRAALDQASRQWEVSAWIHGDVTAGNIIVHDDRAVLVDWESAGLGDPAWDLATAVSTVTSLSGSAETFLTEYWRLGGPAQLNDAVLTARAIQSAWQVAVLGLQREDTALDGSEHLEGARRHAASFLATGGGR
ncbi:MAG: phosphotransferase family protein [Arachnia sp.]